MRPPGPSSPRGNGGFTLVELVTTVTVAAILAAIAVPSYKSFARNARMTTQANEFILALNLARSEAVKRGATVSIVGSATAANEFGGGWTLCVNPNNDTDCADTGDEVRRTGDALEGAMTLDNLQNASIVTFRSTGVTTVSPVVLTFNLCDDVSGGRGRVITVSQTGQVGVSDLTCP